MAVVIFILLFALFAFLNGDPSGVEAIIKIIVVGAFAICIAFIATEPVFWAIIGILFLMFILYLICVSISKSISSSVSHISEKEKIKTQEVKDDYSIANDNYEDKTESLSDFQKELALNYKSQSKVETEEYEGLKSSIETQYKLIKEKIKQMAENSQYSIENGQKVITIDYKSYLLESFISRKCQTVYLNKTILKPSGEYGHELIYTTNNNKKYNYFLKILDDLSKHDNMSIIPIMINQSDNCFRTIPCVIQGFGLTAHSYEPRLRCVIKF